MVLLHNPSQASRAAATLHTDPQRALEHVQQIYREQIEHLRSNMQRFVSGETPAAPVHAYYPFVRMHTSTDRKSTRLNSSHLVISYAVFCLTKKKQRRI